jgi:putative protease
LEIENKAGERFIVAHEGCKSIVYGKKAYSLSGLRHLFESRGVADFRIDFLTRNYTLQDMQQVMSSVFADLPIESTHTANFHSKFK